MYNYFQDSEDQPPSILDKDPGAKALLEMINKPQVSEGLREADPTADIPEQKELHPVNWGPTLPNRSYHTANWGPTSPNRSSTWPSEGQHPLTEALPGQLRANIPKQKLYLANWGPTSPNISYHPAKMDNETSNTTITILIRNRYQSKGRVMCQQKLALFPVSFRFF